MKALGLLVEECRGRGEELSDELLVKAVTVQIKSLFPILTKEQLLAEVETAKAKEAERVTLLKKEWEDI